MSLKTAPSLNPKILKRLVIGEVEVFLGRDLSPYSCLNYCSFGSYCLIFVEQTLLFKLMLCATIKDKLNDILILI